MNNKDLSDEDQYVQQTVKKKSYRNANSSRNERYFNITKEFILKFKQGKIWKNIGMAQILSIIICGTAITNNSLSVFYKLNVPTTQSIVNYFILGIIFIPLWYKETKDKKETIRKNWWKYFLIGLADVEANYMIIKAYSLTLVTTIQVIDAFILPITLVLSRLVLKTLYKKNHIIGVVCCLVGCALIITANRLVEDQKGEHSYLGDLLCLGSSILYALSNIGEEFFVKNRSKNEFVAMIGFFGSIISIVQMLILERNELINLNFSETNIILLLISTNLLLFWLYVLFPFVIERTSATFINVNLLTADFYSVFLGIFVFNEKLHALYFVGFITIMFGTIFYCLSEPIEKKISSKIDIEINDININTRQNTTESSDELNTSSKANLNPV